MKKSFSILMIVLLLVFTCSCKKECKHDIHIINEVEATCEASGNEEYYECEVCHKIFSDAEGKNELQAIPVLPVLGHSLKKEEAVEATCTADGHEEYYECETCHKLFSDSNGIQALQNIPLTVAKGHELVKKDAIEPNCEENGNDEYYECNSCHKIYSDSEGKKELQAIPVVAATGHTLTKIDAVEETCTTDGNEEYYECEVCHKLFSDSNASNNLDNKPIIHASHDMNDVNICDRCEYIGRPLEKDISNLNNIINELKFTFNPNIDLSNYEVINSATEGIMITNSGVYQLQGDYNKIEIAKDLGDVYLILDNVNIQATDYSAISSEKGTNVWLILNENTNNTIENFKVQAKKDVNCLTIKQDLNIIGSGNLLINSNSKNSINVSCGLKVLNSNLEMHSKNHCISANYAQLFDCKLKLFADNKDGINVESKEDGFNTKDGYIYFDSVEYEADTFGDGLQADTFVYIIDSNVKIKTTGKYVVKSQENIDLYDLKDDDFAYTKEGDEYVKNPSDTLWMEKTYYALMQSCKGIKAGGIKDKEDNVIPGDYLIYITSSTIDINSFDDCINCKAGNLIIKSGDFTLKSKDDGLTSDHNTIIYDGTFDINTYEGIEGEFVEIQNGDFLIETIDDAINASTDASNVIPQIILTGGNYDITTKVSGDAIDANGRVLIKGGNYIIKTYSQEVLDSDNGTWIDGGEFISFAGMQINSRVAHVDQLLPMILVRKYVSKGTKVKILCNDNTIFEVEAPISCNLLEFFSNDIQLNDTITVFFNDTAYSTFKVENILTETI